VQAALAESATDVPIQGCLCFVAPTGFLADDGLPLWKTLRVSGFPLYYPRRLIKQLNAPGHLTPNEISRIQAELGDRLRPA
jgi:hypothetical protein